MGNLQKPFALTTHYLGDAICDGITFHDPHGLDEIAKSGHLRMRFKSSNSLRTRTNFD